MYRENNYIGKLWIKVVSDFTKRQKKRWVKVIIKNTISLFDQSKVNNDRCNEDDDVVWHSSHQ